MKDIKVKLNEFPTIHIGLGNTIVNTKKVITSHTELEDRELPNQHPITAITGLEEKVGELLAEAKASGEFDGADGRTAYSYAQAGGYTGTEEEFAAKMAEENPGIHIGTETPEDDSVIWIDTDEEPEKELPGPDFAANEGEDGYIKNRTHYVDENGIIHKLPNKFIDADWMATSVENIDDSVVIPEQKLSGTTTIWSNRRMDIQPGITYDVHINGAIYPCAARNNGDGVVLGNNTSLTLNNYPFSITWAGGTATGGMFFSDGSFGSSVYLKVTGHSWKEYNKLPEEFLPDCVVKSVNGNAPDENGNVGVEGGADIDVTAAVGETIIVKEVDANGKPTKWESAEYQPRTHFCEEVELLPEAAGVLDEAEGYFIIPFAELIEKAEYKFIYNGSEYIGSIFNADSGEVLFGNIPLVTETGDNGIPFIGGMLSSDSGDGIGVLIPLDGAEKVNFSIKQNVYTPIPFGYLTDALPYYIEITGSGTEDDPYICNESVAELEDIFSSGRAILLKLPDKENYGNKFIYHMWCHGVSEIGYHSFTFAAATLAPFGLNTIALAPQTGGSYAVSSAAITE